MNESDIVMRNIKAELIKTAQDMIQKFGYNAFSYRDIANEVGIKSASIHYHFPSKADLGEAVAADYRKKFMGTLKEADEQGKTTSELLILYVSLFKQALIEDNKMCLCGMLSAEISSLPKQIAAETKLFFHENQNWLVSVMLRHVKPSSSAPMTDFKTEAALFVASLEGALIVAKGLGDVDVFNKITEKFLSPYLD